MKSGKWTSVLLACVLAAVSGAACVAVMYLPRFRDQLHVEHPTLEALVIVLLLFTVYMLILFPLGASIDHSLVTLRRQIESSAAAPRDHAQWRGPRWLRPLVNAFAVAHQRSWADQETLRRELEDAESGKSRAEAARRQREVVLHTLRNVVIVVDIDQRVVMVNEAAGDLFDLDIQGVVHTPIDEALPEGRLLELIRDELQQDIPSEDGESRYAQLELMPVGAPDASRPKTYDAHLVRVQHEDGEPGGVVAILHDLTHERDLADLKADFVSKASHELRTPLSTIRAYVEMLIDGEAADEELRQQFYRILHAETDRLSQFIDTLLDISRIEAGMVQIEHRPERLGPLIERAVTATQTLAREKELELVVEPPPDDLTVECDRDMVFQVVLNLLSNAIKYTPKGGRVTLVVEPGDRSRPVKVIVTDNGLGIPPEAQCRVFEKFFRVDQDTRGAPGAGLGLTLCKHIVETLHGGHIGFESIVGEGSRFWISLPVYHRGTRTAA